MKYVLKELLRHRWRSVFSITGYAVAALFILIILSLTGSGKKDSFGILQSTGTHFIIYIPTETSCCTTSLANGTVFAEGVKTMMLSLDLITTIKNIEGIKDAAPCLLYRMYNESLKTDISIGGIDTASIATKSTSCARTNLIAGKFISQNPDELVAEQSFAVAHNLGVGDTLAVFGGKMVIAGIVNSGIKPVRADFYAPIEYVRTILKDKLHCSAEGFDMNIILVEVADARLQDAVIARIKNLMYKFTVSSYNCYEPAYRAMSVIERSSAGLTVLIFIFLVIFSVKTQLTSLSERFSEIGILKSLGWSDSRLGKGIFMSSVLQALSGVTAGLLSGIAIIKILNAFDVRLLGLMEFRVRAGSVLLIYALSLAGALIASVFPLLKVIRSKAGDIINNRM